MGASNKFQNESYKILSDVFDNSRSTIINTIIKHLNQEKVNGISNSLYEGILQLYSNYYVAMIKMELDSPQYSHLTLNQVKEKYLWDSLCKGFSKHKIDIESKLNGLLK